MPEFEIEKVQEGDDYFHCYVRNHNQYGGPPHRDRAPETNVVQGARLVEGRESGEWALVAVKIPQAPIRGTKRAKRLARHVLEDIDG
jgi:hypothetical protein